MASFRPNVALVLRNPGGQVLVCERSDIEGAWQFPQGGIKRGETAREALAREVIEEIGLEPAAYAIRQSCGPYRYRFAGQNRKAGFDGQEQTYFLADLTDPNAAIRLPAHGGEFTRWQWVAPADFRLSWLPPMKRPIYQAVLESFFGVRPGG